GETLDLSRGAFDQHDVAELQLEVIQVAGDIFILAMHGQYGDAVACSEVKVAHRTVAVARITSDDGLSEDNVMAGNGLEGFAAIEGQVPAAAQLHHILDLAMDYQLITRSQHGVMAWFGEFFLFAEDLQYLQATAAVQIGLAEGLADHRRIMRHQ